METHHHFCRAARRALLSFVGIVMSGCGGGEEFSPPQQVSHPPVAASTGVLTITVTDSDGRAVSDARVSVFNAGLPSTFAGSAHTDSNGLASVGPLPALVNVTVFHDFGYHLEESIVVPQQGGRSVGVTLLPRRPRPTLALLPALIPHGSVNEERNELTLRITVVASSSAPFRLSEYGDNSATSTPSLALELGENADGSRRECFVWLDQRRTIPSCGTPWGVSPYTVSVEQFRYEPTGAAPLPVSPSSPQTTMLLIDQSRRVSTLDPGAFRSYAARRFIERVVGPSEQKTLSVAGFAGSGGDPSTPLSLPAEPLWVPPGAGTIFTNDEVILKSNAGILEPLVGGTAPVFDALEAAIGLIAVSVPSGDRTVVALLGGGDDRALTESGRDRALTSLRRRRDDTGVRTILIDAAPYMPLAEHRAIAELASALRAPTVSLGVSMNERQHSTQSWAAASFAALDLAADLSGGARLPTLSAVFRVRADAAGAFPTGALLRGVLHVETEICPIGCWEVPLAFAAEIP